MKKINHYDNLYMLTTQFSVVHWFQKLGSSVMKADKGTIGLFEKVSSYSGTIH